MPPRHLKAAGYARFEAKKGEIVVTLAWDKKVPQPADDNSGTLSLSRVQALKVIEQISRCLVELETEAKSTPK
jgi:hypothetical protein